MRIAIATTCAFGFLAGGALPAFASHQEEAPREALATTVLRTVPEDATAEREAIEIFIGDPENLSDGQVADLNQSLHNTGNGWIPVIALDDLMEIAENEYNKQQIFAFTKAREEFTKFTGLGMDDKAEAQLDKFSAKVKRMSDLTSTSEPAAVELATELAAREARQLAKDAAKATVSEESRSAARLAVKAEARDNAKRLARREARNHRKADRALGKPQK